MKAYVECAKGIITLDHNERIDSLDTVNSLLKFYGITPLLIRSIPVTTYGELEYKILSIMLKDVITASGARIVRCEWFVYAVI